MNRKTFTQKYGPWAVVTGASEGIGRAFAEQLAELGMNVVLVARRRDRLQHIADKLREQHKVDTLIIAADLSTSKGGPRWSTALATWRLACWWRRQASELPALC